MIEAKHAPGPWKFSIPEPRAWDPSPGPERIIDANGQPIYAAWIGICADETGKANARLIAAAPDMLDALEEIVSYVAPTLKSEFRLSQGLAAALQHSRAAIAKATGAA